MVLEAAGDFGRVQAIATPVSWGTKGEVVGRTNETSVLSRMPTADTGRVWAVSGSKAGTVESSVTTVPASVGDADGGWDEDADAGRVRPHIGGSVWPSTSRSFSVPIQFVFVCREKAKAWLKGYQGSHQRARRTKRRCSLWTTLSSLGVPKVPGTKMTKLARSPRSIPPLARVARRVLDARCHLLNNGSQGSCRLRDALCQGASSHGTPGPRAYQSLAEPQRPTRPRFAAMTERALSG